MGVLRAVLQHHDTERRICSNRPVLRSIIVQNSKRPVPTLHRDLPFCSQDGADLGTARTVAVELATPMQPSTLVSEHLGQSGLLSGTARRRSLAASPSRTATATGTRRRGIPTSPTRSATRRAGTGTTTSRTSAPTSAAFTLAPPTSCSLERS